MNKAQIDRATFYVAKALAATDYQTHEDVAESFVREMVYLVVGIDIDDEMREMIDERKAEEIERVLAMLNPTVFVTVFKNARPTLLDDARVGENVEVDFGRLKRYVQETIQEYDEQVS